jgi:tetratricopeptide (TPR) repeat protein
VEPKNQSLLYNFGVMYWSWKKYAKALQAWEKALQIDPDFSQAKQWAKKARKKITGK